MKASARLFGNISGYLVSPQGLYWSPSISIPLICYIPTNESSISPAALYLGDQIQYYSPFVKVSTPCPWYRYLLPVKLLTLFACSQAELVVSCTLP